jgi:hypothetical protein
VVVVQVKGTGIRGGIVVLPLLVGIFLVDARRRRRRRRRGTASTEGDGSFDAGNELEEVDHTNLGTQQLDCRQGTQELVLHSLLLESRVVVQHDRNNVCTLLRLWDETEHSRGQVHAAVLTRL